MIKEPILIVDENDNIIGIKDRGLVGVGSPDIYRVSALWVTNGRGDALLVQRAFTKRNDPGKWGPAVSRTVEAGETYDSNILKEAREEIGLSDMKFRKSRKVRRYGDHNFFVQWYVAVVDIPAESFETEAGSIEDIRWFPIDELRKETAFFPEKFVPNMYEYLDLSDGIVSG
ncbi:MAG: NUDIX domain-containing protein [Candidatus Moranbacteria bacterium]|nr:NUDIX domain-containing protein [Candidatus Moranbacteria bacterium]